MKEAPLTYEGFSLTFNTTEDCNLRCKYCYETDKKSKTLSIYKARKFIDFFLSTSDPLGLKDTKDEWILDSGLVLEFIGGDALMNPQLIRDIMYYFIWNATLKNHPWANKWRISICTNGTLFEEEGVKEFLEEFKESISLAISIDGCPAIHDSYRVFPNGTGSSSAILKNWGWYLDYCKRSKQLPLIKATLSKDSIPYLYESLKYLHEDLKLQNINMNFIMEETKVTEEDLNTLDSELSKCYEYMLQHGKHLYWSLFDKYNIGEPFTEDNKQKTKCGSGMMPTLGVDGNIYPCFRWLPPSMPRGLSKKFILGTVNKLNTESSFNSLRNATYWEISDKECRECEVQSACNYCIAGCYSEFKCMQRTKYLCGITKILSKWVKQYWSTQ